MQTFLNLVISGIVTGGIYSIMAAGLVLTYETSGVFNFAHAAVAFCAAYFYFELNTGQSIPIVPAAILTIAVFAPLLGLALDRLVYGRLAHAPVYARVVGTIGILIFLPNFALWLVDAVMKGWWHLNVADLSTFGGYGGFNVPGIGPTPAKVFDLGWAKLSNVHISTDQLAVFCAAGLVALVLYIVIRRTRIGLDMRAQVDRAPLAALRGIDPGRTSGMAWMLSATLAGLGGVLISPLFQLDSDTFTLVVFASLAAVAVAGLRSIPIAFAAGLGLGVLQNLVAGYQKDILPSFLNTLTGVESAVPYVVLIVVLLFLGRKRGRAAGSASEEKPPPDHRAGLPSWRRKLPWAILTLVIVLYATGALPWPTNQSYVLGSILAPGLALAIVFLSFCVVTGIGGMVSLAQATFVTAGGFAAGWALQTTGASHPPPWAKWSFNIPLVLNHGHLNFVVACLIGMAAAGALGALIALSVRHLGALELALGTFALAWVVYFLVFQNNGISNGQAGYVMPVPVLNLFGIHTFNFSVPSDQVLLLLVLFGLVVVLIHNLQRSRSGRAMYAVRSSSVAAQTAGISPARSEVGLFALSAAIAGFGGVMWGVTQLSITQATAVPLTGLIWLAVAVTFGIRRPGGAMLAGLAYSAGAEIWHEVSLQSWMPPFITSLTTSQYFLPMLFGLGAIGLAREPDGVLALVGNRRLEKQRARSRSADTTRAESTEADVALHPVQDAVSGDAALEETAPAMTPNEVPDGKPSMPVILLENAVAGYGDVEVLHGVSVAVQKGQIVTLLGANGAGKSTLCGVASGSVPITTGRVVIDGRDMSGAPVFVRARAGLLVVPEARGIFPRLTVQENLQILLRDASERENAYQRFPILGDRRNQVAGLLSGGEQQMLSLAPALADPPLALIADEPTLGLAPLAAEVVIEALCDLRDMGTAVLLVEEKASEVLRVADYVVIMELGRVAWAGPRKEASQEKLAVSYLGGAMSNHQKAVKEVAASSVTSIVNGPDNARSMS